MITNSAPDALRAGLAGMRRGADALAHVARRTAAGPTDPVRSAENAVGMLEAEHAVAAGAAVVRTADRMTGTLLDLFG